MILQETSDDDSDMNLSDLTDSDNIDFCEPKDNEKMKDLNDIEMQLSRCRRDS